VTEGLMERERLASTALGLGVALPHARIKGLKRPLAVFIRLHSPIAFDAPDNQPVADVFVLLVPEQATELHLQMLAEVAAKFGDPVFRNRLNQQQDALAAYGVLVGVTGLPLPDQA
jgi:PTS system nitrogen regulatory IIA component